MNSDRVSPSSSMLELVRTLNAGRGRRVGKNFAGAARQSQVPQPSSRHDLTVLRSQLVAMVAPIDPDDADGLARVRRPLLGAIVLWEFGEAFRLDPEFSPMLDALERAFAVESGISDRFAALVRGLRE